MRHDRRPSLPATYAPMPLYAAGEDVTAPIMAQLARVAAYRRAGDVGKAIRGAESGGGCRDD